MAASYKKLWKLLIDRDMKKKDLMAAAGVSAGSLAKLEKAKASQPAHLIKYAKENGIKLAGTCRHIYLEGPPQHKNPKECIAQVAMLIKS